MPTGLKTEPSVSGSTITSLVDSPVGIGWRHPHYDELLARQPSLDFLEVHSENFFVQGGAALALLEQARSTYPISLHGVGLSLGSAVGVDEWHLDQLAQLVKRIDPVRVSDHACFARGTFKAATVHAGDLLPIPFNTEALHVLCANVQRVQDRLQRQLMVENLSAYLSWESHPEQGPRSETDFLNELTQRTGCALLVDVNNLYVNALNAQKASAAGDPLRHCLTWLDAIVPATVGEIHLAGHCHVSDEWGDIVIDDHGSRVCAPVWQLYRHALECFGPTPTLIEWDTDIPVLNVLLGEAAVAKTMSQTCTRLLP
jgi:uncharacterized protein